MKTFNEIKKSLKKDVAGLKQIKVAMLGDTATQFLVQALRGTGVEHGYNLSVWEADFNQIDRQVYDPNSELYEFAPQIIIVFQSTHKLLGKYNKYKSDHTGFAAAEIASIQQLHTTINSKSGAKIIYYNYPEIDDSIFGNFANKTESSFLFQLRKLNYELMNLAVGVPDMYICDLSSVQNQVSKSQMFHSSVYVNTEMVLGIDVLPLVADRTVSIINAVDGRFKKCVILDLDNTTWGGIIGDDGLENIQVGSLGIGKAFSEFQQWIKKLKNRGIIVAVCSKNTESVAKEPFEKHPDMVLRLDDIAVFVANWENKADNIRHIQSILNIGFDSMVFLDDNPFERNLVRENLPLVSVPELPEDPADYLEFLYNLNLFETASASREDAARTKLYQIEARRSTQQQQFTNEGDFLQSLAMVSLIEPFNKFNTPRVAQLSQRSNQFNLRTVRYTEGDIAELARSTNHDTFAFTLEDKFGDNGLICVVVVQRLSAEVAFIESWFMSCRVLKRGMEEFVLGVVANQCKNNGFSILRGEYLATPKNDMVRNHYGGLGFIENNGMWDLDLKNYTNTNTFISKKIK